MKLQRSWRFGPATGVAVALVAVASSLAVGLLGAAPASATVTITAEPITWPLVGVRSNVSNTKTGPDRFPIGTRFCNTGTTSASDVQTRFVLEGNGNGSQAGFSVDSRSTESLGSIPNGECRDSYLNVLLEQSPSVRGNSREYYVEACNGACNSNNQTPSTNKYAQYPGSSSTRVLYIESLVRQNRNVTRKISGPGGCNFDFTQCDPPPSNLQVGKTYTYKLYASTSTGYEQVESFITFPAQSFQILGAQSTFSTPAGLSISQPWANACGWNLNYPSPTTKCSGPIPQDFQPGGKAGRNIVTTYRVKVIAPVTSGSLTSLIYDLSGSSFHYNADYGDPAIGVNYTANYPLTTTVTGSGQVTSTSSPTQTGQVNCGVTGSACNVSYPSATSVTLTASTVSGSTFNGWSGACSGTSTTCTVTMSQARSVGASFTGTTYYPLNVTIAGKGGVTSSPGGINCTQTAGSDCGEPYSSGTSVTLTASPAEGYDFIGWSGACSGASRTCDVTMSQANEVEALFQPSPVVTRTLTVTDLPVDADGETLPPTGGTVTSAPSGTSGGINLSCGFQCLGEYVNGTSVTVTATPSSGYKLVSWGGACSSTAVSGDGTAAQTCTVSMTQNQQVSVKFVTTGTTTTYSLATSTRKDGNAPTANVGTVTGNLGGLTCSYSDSTNCSKNYLSGTEVTLTATPASGYLFAGWQDSTGATFAGCTGGVDPVSSTTCGINMTANQTVRANFTAVSSTYLGVSILGQGDGTVKSPSSGTDIYCSTGDVGTCEKADYSSGASVTLTATANPGSSFAGWGGACSGTSSTCTVTMDQARFVTATFDLIELRKLTVQKTGNGNGATAGTYNNNPVTELDCGDSCTQAKEKNFNKNSVVTLTATPEGSSGTNPSRFGGWKTLEGTPTDACSGSPSSTTCAVTMSQARSVVGQFIGIRPLTVEIRRVGNGNGAVTTTNANWANLDVQCGAGIPTPRCALDYDLNSVVTLTQTPSAGSEFRGWSFTRTLSTRSMNPLSQSRSGSALSGCGPTDTTCTVTLDQARFVEASFSATYDLTLTKGGTGQGSVTSTPAGISCGDSCSSQAATYSDGTSVTLTATPASGSTFTGWSGACTGSGATCTVSMSQARNVTATFTLIPSYALSVTKAGTGSGGVTSSPAGINCGNDCNENYTDGTSVTLTAAPSSGSTFTGWTGDVPGSCTTATTCTMSMDQARNVTATFTLIPSYTLAVTRDGTGSGSLSSSPAGIDCGNDCSESYLDGTSVTLTASPASGSSFTAWGGACAGVGNEPPSAAPWTCTLTMSQARSATATFTADPPPPGSYTLSVNKAGTGSGGVTSSPAGIDCGNDCNENFADGTSVTLTANPSSGSSFTGWTGACSGSSTTCTVSMTQARSVTATFTLVPTYGLSVNRDGTGSGGVTSSPAGIDCGNDCNQDYLDGTSVTLTVTPSPGSSFTGWGGACAGIGTAPPSAAPWTCTVSMTQARSVTATFTADPSPPATFDLEVTKGGSGSGTLTSEPAGIDCVPNCKSQRASFLAGRTVTLTAEPKVGSTFSRWSGACSGSGRTCEVTMNGSRIVEAVFDLGSPRLGIAVKSRRQVLREGRETTVKVTMRSVGTGIVRKAQACLPVPRRFAVLSTDGGTLKGRKICWPRVKSMNPGTRKHYFPKFRALAPRTAVFEASAEAADAKKVEKKAKVRVKPKPKRPKPLPPTG